MQFLNVSKLLTPERSTTEHVSRRRGSASRAWLRAGLPTQREGPRGPPLSPPTLLCDTSSRPDAGSWRGLPRCPLPAPRWLRRHQKGTVRLRNRISHRGGGGSGPATESDVPEHSCPHKTKTPAMKSRGRQCPSCPQGSWGLAGRAAFLENSWDFAVTRAGGCQGLGERGGRASGFAQVWLLPMHQAPSAPPGTGGLRQLLGFPWNLCYECSNTFWGSSSEDERGHVVVLRPVWLCLADVLLRGECELKNNPFP